MHPGIRVQTVHLFVHWRRRHLGFFFFSWHPKSLLCHVSISFLVFLSFEFQFWTNLPNWSLSCENSSRLRIWPKVLSSRVWILQLGFLPMQKSNVVFTCEVFLMSCLNAILSFKARNLSSCCQVKTLILILTPQRIFHWSFAAKSTHHDAHIPPFALGQNLRLRATLAQEACVTMND